MKSHIFIHGVNLQLVFHRKLPFKRTGQCIIVARSQVIVDQHVCVHFFFGGEGGGRGGVNSCFVMHFACF